MKKIKYRTLKRSDDAKILNILDLTPLPGPATIIYSSHPSYFDAVSSTSEEHIELGAEIDSNLVAFIGVSVQRRLIGRIPKRIGYLSGLRVLPSYRRKGIVSGGVKHLKLCLKKLRISACFASIVDGNNGIKRIIQKYKPGYPFFLPFAKIHTKLFWPQKGDSICKVTIAEARDFPALHCFINQESLRKNFSPQISKSFVSTDPKKTVLIAWQKGSIIGTATVWDQTSFKQMIITQYHFPLTLMVKMVNLLWAQKGETVFPDQKGLLSYHYLYQIFIKDDNPNVLDALLIFMAKSDRMRSLLAIGLHEKDPLNRALRRHPGVMYKSTLYLVSWKKDDRLADHLRAGVIYPEVALL